MIVIFTSMPLKAAEVLGFMLITRDMIALATDAPAGALSSDWLWLESAVPWIEIIATASLVSEAILWDVSQLGQLIQRRSHPIQTTQTHLRNIIAR